MEFTRARRLVMDYNPGNISHGFDRISKRLVGFKSIKSRFTGSEYEGIAKFERGFLDKVTIAADENEDCCWGWVGAKNHSGVGFMSGRRNIFGTDSRVLCHHVSYFLFIGDLPKDGRNILHVCGCRSCPNPLHLYTGSPKDLAKYSWGFEYGSNLEVDKKITSKMVPIIRELLENGATITEVAKECSVEYGIIYNIKHNHTWTSVQW